MWTRKRIQQCETPEVGGRGENQAGLLQGEVYTKVAKTSSYPQADPCPLLPITERMSQFVIRADWFLSWLDALRTDLVARLREASKLDDDRLYKEEW